MICKSEGRKSEVRVSLIHPLPSALLSSQVAFKGAKSVAISQVCSLGRRPFDHRILSKVLRRCETGLACTLGRGRQQDMAKQAGQCADARGHGLPGASASVDCIAKSSPQAVADPVRPAPKSASCCTTGAEGGET